MTDPKTNDVKQSAEDKRESGVPGGGQGRKDEVGRSGVYPMSGPHPAGAAEVKGQASWGQGERGAAGYEDHGGSELTFEGGQLVGGLNAGPGGEPVNTASTTDAGDMEVQHEEWIRFLDSFSRQHQDWIISIEVASPAGRLMEVEQNRFQGISMDRTEGKERAYVEVGDTRDQHFTHIVDDPTRIRLKRDEAGVHEGLEIDSADGTTTVIRFQHAARPDVLDDIAA